MIRASQPAAGKVKAAGDLEQVLTRARSIIMADFTGLPVADFDQLRLTCFKNRVEFVVAKNNIEAILE